MIAVTGASGFVGRAVCEAIESRGGRVIRIGRRSGDVRWPHDGSEFDQEALGRLQGVRGVIHLAGETIGVRWTAGRRRAIRDSRVTLTDILAKALVALDPRPDVLVSTSAVGYYGDCGDTVLDESHGPGADFLATVARDWEAASAPARAAGIRVVHPRMGVVLGPRGGMISQLRLPFRLGLGARLGSGEQWMSWIALPDAVRVLLKALDDASVAGAVNAVSPAPVTNATFTRALGRAIGRPTLLAVPAFALRAAFGAMADGLLLSSQRAVPARLLAAGFAFEHPSLDTALRAALEP